MIGGKGRSSEWAPGVVYGARVIVMRAVGSGQS